MVVFYGVMNIIMEVINMTITDMNTVISGVTLIKVCSVKADEDSTESKQVTVNVRYDGLTLKDVFTKALSSDIIKWQAGARKRFDTLPKVETITAKSPGAAPQVNPEEAIKAKLTTFKTKKDRLEYLNSLMEGMDETDETDEMDETEE
jgi:hypothetical protein